VTVTHRVSSAYERERDPYWVRALCGQWHWRSPEVRDEYCGKRAALSKTPGMWWALRDNYPAATEETMTEDARRVTCLLCLAEDEP
jgi:hypothetical protein